MANRGVQLALCGDAEVRWDLGLRPHGAQVFRNELQIRLRHICWQAATPLAASFADPTVSASWGELA